MVNGYIFYIIIYEFPGFHNSVLIFYYIKLSTVKCAHKLVHRFP